MLRELLLEYLLRPARTAPREVLFQTDHGEPYHPSTLAKMLRTWGAKVGVALSPHKLRHTYATGLAMAGIPPHLIQAYLGRASLATTSLYRHTVQAPTVQAALERWANLGSVVEGVPPGERHATRDEH